MMFARKASRRVTVVAIGTLIALLVLASTVLAATLVRGGGAVTAIQTVTANDYQFLSTRQGATMPGTTVTITVPHGERALLVVTFSGNMRCSGQLGYLCAFRARLDGQGLSPGEVSIPAVDVSPNFDVKSMQFVAGPVGGGQHTIDVRWRTNHASWASFDITGRTLTVLRSKV